MQSRKIFVPLLGLALAGMACATTTFYTSQSLFNTAAAALTFQTITDLSSSEFTGSGLVDPSTGVTFTDQTGGSSFTVVDGMTLKLASTFAMEISVPSTYTAYWFDIVTVNSGGTVNESSSSPSSSNSFLTTGAPIFFGVITDTPVSGLQLASGTSGGVEIDNFNVAGAGAASPEGGTMLMIGGGLILLRAFRGRRLRAQE